jgi:tetratricopeptide (TPR) repeat protein
MSSPKAEAAGGGISFALAGIPVRVRAAFLVTAALLALMGGEESPAKIALWAAIVLLSVLWHELGHALAAIGFGFKPEIELAGMGGLTHTGATAAIAWWKDIIISLAGPLAGLLLGGAVWTLARVSPPESDAARFALDAALWANVGWSLINLLPVLPYDGGAALRAGLVARFSRRGDTAAHIVTLVVGIAACGVALSVRMIWAAYLAGAASGSALGWLGKQRSERRIDAAWAALHAGQRAAAGEQIAAIMRGGAEPAIQARAAELAGWIAVHGGDTAAAREALKAIPLPLQPSDLIAATIDTLDGKDTQAALRAIDPALLLGQWSHLEAALFHTGRYEAALAIATRAFEAHGNATSAYNAACCLSRLGRADTALPWLERAVDAGYRDLPHLQADEDLAPVRALPGFAPIAQRLA